MFLLASLSAQEQIAPELSLEQAVSLALENNLDIKKAGIDLATSGYSEKRLWSEIFPSISASASWGFSSPLFSGDGFELNDRSIRSSIGFGINLNLNAGIPYAMKSIKLAHEVNLLNYENARNQLSIQVTKNYYSLIAEKDNLNLLNEVYNLAQRLYDRNQISFRNGLISELALTQTRLAAENARYNLSAANISYNNNMAEFLALIGMETDTAVTLLGEINIIKISADSETLINQYLPQRPDIIRNKNEIDRLKLAEKRTVMQNRAPSVGLSLDWSTSKFNPFTDSFSGTARISIPVDSWIPGTARSQDIRRADASLEKAVLDLSITENAAKNTIRTLTARLNNSWDSILIARLSMEASQRNYELTERGFNNGTVEYLVLEDARNNLAGARQRLLQSELAYFTMMLDLAGALNIEWEYLADTYGVTSE